MSLYPTGVCVVSAEIEGAAPFAITVNSFTSLSLEPPLVMWNLQKTADKYKQWRDAEAFAVNMLRADQAAVAQHFAQRGEGKIAAPDLRYGPNRCPALADCLATLICTVHARYEEGDHVIVIGEVVEMWSDEQAEALTFYKGRYGAVDSAS
jgi:flavin reductase (DIM6/NTAB) family NADH-FMN oxidoreductase RutF